MLLPSALSCDMRRPVSRSRLTPSRLLTTPPPSDDDSPPGNGLLGTCRALQSLLRSPSPSPRRTKPQRLQSPLEIRPAPSARSRKPKTHSSHQQPQSTTTATTTTITLRPRQPSHTPQSPPPRGANKRRRDSCEDDDDEEIQDSDVMRHRRIRFSTPKRPRHVPYDLPLGLSQSDFYTLHSPPITQSPPSPVISRQIQRVDADADDDGPAPYNPDAALPSIEEADETSPSSSAPPAPDSVPDWSADDDQRLVQVVLEKFQLSRGDWDDCAARMGLDQASVGRRWQALVGDGNVGLRRGGRMTRGRIDEMWM
ncbi:hypothetical protein P168DRAFT_302599 [Aspergillus campestris IBT 28561]|uniref:Myb-like domain-containing protein n=1 Tax=Aspergillus campestris (strain IBT 28561) TaxID=1392248 RepID=A0A2I1D8M4_ASPC2|nr:uncharacterized protein P168DRAFT_302599 [Aspergillus campestris IBT 28561]PKY06220.1 hypothetical protein P168DRAFT_302599 [Aspergillus campestris IBT 28561]